MRESGKLEDGVSQILALVATVTIPLGNRSSEHTRTFVPERDLDKYWHSERFEHLPR